MDIVICVKKCYNPCTFCFEKYPIRPLCERKSRIHARLSPIYRALLHETLTFAQSSSPFQSDGPSVFNLRQISNCQRHVIWSSLSYQSLALFILLFSGLECAPAFLQGSNYQLVPKYKVFLRFLCYTTSMISSSESVRPDIKIREGGCSL